MVDSVGNGHHSYSDMFQRDVSGAVSVPGKGEDMKTTREMAIRKRMAKTIKELLRGLDRLDKSLDTMIRHMK